MNDVVFRDEVLKLNHARLPNSLGTPEKVFGALLTFKVNARNREYLLDEKGRKQRKMKAFYFEFDGGYSVENITNVRLLDGTEWLQLTPRWHDLYINTPSRKVVIPRVVWCMEDTRVDSIQYGKSYNHIYELYDGVCQYTKRKLKRNEGNRDHVIPLSRGGADDNSNIVLSAIEVNNFKGSRLNKECGLPEVVPIIPKKKPKFLELRKINAERKIPEWTYFLGE